MHCFALCCWALCSVLHFTVLRCFARCSVLHLAVLYFDVLHWRCSNIAVHLRERSWPRPGSAELQLHSHCNTIHYTSHICTFLKILALYQRYTYILKIHLVIGMCIPQKNGQHKYSLPRNICTMQQKQYQQPCQKRKNVIISFGIFMTCHKMAQSNPWKPFAMSLRLVNTALLQAQSAIFCFLFFNYASSSPLCSCDSLGRSLVVSSVAS